MIRTQPISVLKLFLLYTVFDWVTDRLALRLIWSKWCLITFVSHGWVTDLLCRFVTAFHCRSELQFFSLTSTDDTINLRHNGDKMLSEVVFLFFIYHAISRDLKCSTDPQKKVLIINENDESFLFSVINGTFRLKNLLKFVKTKIEIHCGIRWTA